LAGPLHDAIAFPLYTVFNRLALGRAGRSVNHVRVPALLSGLRSSCTSR